jgi:uncharacterized membrane protein YgdD (TMEM256/DUF423 family)
MNDRKKFKDNYVFYFIGISGGFSVLFSAWLSHTSKMMTNVDSDRLMIALAMQFIHTLVLLISAVWLKIERYQLTLKLTSMTTKSVNKAVQALTIAIWCFMLGILLFSGLLYAKTFLPLGFLGKLTPFGGISLTLGWIMLAIATKE